ncbi:DUF2330 domain-containing protein [Thermogemmatispora tikiterensis]|uniref:DUF2330 domain-containing protein n=1 Tax=Thermogemmatispora tikiterensis TaxID=1825093 RepID=A0A328VLN6_9CHLR|nr:DUF2330 domain-containing protein [Thermogemmatispora tikiterensis]RAQ96533.1 hypothetical protein A4R35_13385 [Thermogemmatispora tikiterensis]
MSIIYRLWKGPLAALLLLLLTLLQAEPALACGGLLAPNGSVRLQRATTLVAWHAGIEYYLTSFTYQGDASRLGWIVPLPTAPLRIQEGGAWTLQRLSLEVQQRLLAHEAVPAAVQLSAASVQVVQRVQIAALNITVVKGKGAAVLDWATQHGFLLDEETRDHLLVYGQASPFFMAVQFDAAQARQRGLTQGDGTPLLITMRLPQLWVPLEVLAIGTDTVNADLFLLTDQPLYTSDWAYHLGLSPVGSQVPGAPGLQIRLQEPLNETLYHDLVSDRNMSWVWPGSWLTYLSLTAPAPQVTYDLQVSPQPGLMHAVSFGTPPQQLRQPSGFYLPEWVPALPQGTLPILLETAGLLLLVAGLALWHYRSRGGNMPGRVSSHHG